MYMGADLFIIWFACMSVAAFTITKSNHTPETTVEEPKNETPT